MKPTQKAAMQQALRLAESIARPTSRGSWNPTTIQLREHCDVLRNALAEPAVEPFGYVSEHNCAEPYKFQFHTRFTGIYLDNCVSVTPVFASPPPPAEPAVEPVAWVHKNDFGRLMFSSSPTVPPWSFSVFTADQLREALASQADELKQLREQNTALDAKLANYEPVMRQALSAICASGLSGTATKKARNAAIKALDDALK